jgi:hypothetical protein
MCRDLQYYLNVSDNLRETEDYEATLMVLLDNRVSATYMGTSHLARIIRELGN